LLFVCEQVAAYIRQAISASPANKAEEVTGSDGAVYHIVRSQPLGHGFEWNESQLTFAEASIYLSNFGHGKSFALEATRVINLFFSFPARFTHQSSAPAPGSIPAPEAVQGEKVDRKSDIWALGIAVRETLSNF